MALFPAYAEADNLDDNNTFNDGEVNTVFYEVSEAMEVQLLASDEEELISSKVVPQSKELSPQDFYLDRKLDRGNLRVSTLYYPGRPQYSYVNFLTIGAERTKNNESNRWRRYFSKHLTDEPDASVHERLVAYRKLLAETPGDVQIWEAYIDFQEVCGTMDGALDAAREAVAQLPYSARLRDRLYCLLQTVLPHRQYLEEIRNMLTKEKRVSVRSELWARLVRDAGADGSVGTDTDVLRAALADTAHYAPAAPTLIHAFGSYLRTAGLWERLVLAVELLVAMNLPALHAPTAPAFPPPTDVAALQRAERRLLELEDKAIGSGLPRHVVWARVERARAGAHWRPAPPLPAAPTALDPQRAPLPHDVADLLLPLVGAGRLLHLATRLLLLAKVPMVPATEYWARTLGNGDGCAEELLPLAYAHRLVAGGPPAGTARLLELLTDPPHYFSDDTGFSSWVSALWEACGAGVAAGAGAGEALLCWRLRWLHARLLLCTGPHAHGEAARLRNEARSLLKRLAQSSPLAFAEFARLEASAGGGAGGTGGAGGAERALAAATHALRAAIADADRPTTDALYIARVVCEVCEVGVTGVAGVAAGAGECALVCAALRRPPPLALTSPDAELREAALLMCEERCSALEQSLAEDAEGAESAEGATGAEDGGVLAALRPGATEWARARAALAGPARRAQLLRQLLFRQGWAAAGAAGAAALRYAEESACELVRRGGAHAARLAPALARLYPGNAYLNLVSAHTPAWRGAALSVERRAGALAAPRSPTAALARLLPALARAALRDWEPAEAERAVRAARRATGAGGAAARAARVECEARASAPRLPHALLAALHHAPHDKWLHVRGAAWCGGEAAALADALLEKQLRLHALPDELAPLPPPTEAAYTSPPSHS